MRSMPRWARRGAVLATALLGSALVLASCTSQPKGRNQASGSPSEVATGGERVNPLVAKDGGVRNATLYYQGTTPLEPGQDLSKLGKSAIVVTTPRTDEHATIEAIHSTGAQAYRYVQFYWSPSTRRYEGIDLSEHPDWAFCGRGSKPLVGRTTQEGGTPLEWVFIDANEEPVRATITTALTKLKQKGWDGVMFDRGGAALFSARDESGRPAWDARSSCTGQPFRRGARFADAYVGVLGLAKDAGLGVMLNYGISPFDPSIPLRVDPTDENCRMRRWADCGHLGDAWRSVDLVLNEAVAFPRDQQWQRTFDGNRASEHDATDGRRVLGLITTNTLGGRENQTRPKVFYEWSRAKLFDIAVGVNTGDGGCANSPDGVCNRYGVHPDLVNVQFGKPRTREPRSAGCARGSTIHCVWKRTYTEGVDVLNASAKPRAAYPVIVPGDACRYVFDVFAHRPLAHNKCVTSVRLDLPAWSGRPLLTSASSLSSSAG